MAVDRYTKAVLTVIAVCLLWLSLGGPSLLPTASAQSQGVVLTGWVDGLGTVRPFPDAVGVARGEPGRPIPPAPLPVTMR